MYVVCTKVRCYFAALLMMVCVCLRSKAVRVQWVFLFSSFVFFFSARARGRRKNCWNFIRVICRQFSHTLRLAKIFYFVFRCRSVRSFLGSVRFFVFSVCLVYRVFGSHLHYPHLTTGGFFHLLSSMQYDSLHRIANPTIEQVPNRPNDDYRIVFALEL